MASQREQHEVVQPLVAILVHRPESQSTPFPCNAITGLLATISKLQANVSNNTSETPSLRPFEHEATTDAVRVLTIHPSVPLSALRNHPTLVAYESTHSVQLVLQPLSTYSTPKRLAVFDMDSTLIQNEVIDLLADTLGPPVSTSVAEVTERAMNGELDFSQSLRERVAQLKGVQSDVWDTLKEKITITSGAKDLLRWLRESGCKTAVFSGGFVPLAKWLAEELGIDHVEANELEVDEEKKLLTGNVKDGVVIVDSGRKRQLLTDLRSKYSLKWDEVIAVGDGANDLPMMWESGLGIAVNAKKKVQEEAPSRLNGSTALQDVRWLCSSSA